MITKVQIDQFFSSPVALAGVSRNPKKFGYMAFQTMLEKNRYDLYPVNPNAGEIAGKKCYPDVASLPSQVQSILIMTGKQQTAEVVKQALAKGLKNIWLQQGSENPEALKFAREAGVNLIHGKCIMMFAEPRGIHKFHRSIVKFFGGLPK